MQKNAGSMIAAVCVLSLGIVSMSSRPAQSQAGLVPVKTPLQKAVSTPKGSEAEDQAPTGRGIGTLNHRDSSPRPGGSNIMRYHGGPVMVGMKHIYYIWYGDWSKNTAAIQTLQDFASNLGGSPYFNINTSYYDGKGSHVQNSAVLAASTFDAYSMGKSLQYEDIQAVVFKAIDSGLLPEDPMGVYFVLTSADVDQTYNVNGWSYGFCSSFCGWHSFAQHNQAAIKFSFVGNADRCPRSCSAQQVSPNGNVGADAMASVIAHELEEAATDPKLDAWYTTYGMENGDMCAWNFGQTQSLPSGARYNMTLGKKNYLIQQNWVNDGAGYCALSYH